MSGLPTEGKRREGRGGGRCFWAAQEGTGGPWSGFENGMEGEKASADKKRGGTKPHERSITLRTPTKKRKNFAPLLDEN